MASSSKRLMDTLNMNSKDDSRDLTLSCEGGGVGDYWGHTYYITPYCCDMSHHNKVYFFIRRSCVSYQLQMAMTSIHIIYCNKVCSIGL